MIALSSCKCARYCAGYFFPDTAEKYFHMANLTHETIYEDPRLVGYARVSTVEQNLDMQIEALVKYGVPRDDIWSEKRSAAAKERKALDRCLKFMEPGDTLVVWRMDRLARSVSDLIRIIEELRGRQIDFVSLTERIETATPTGKLLFNITAAFAQFERDLAQYRTTEGMRRKMATGWKPGPKRILSEAQENQVYEWRKKGLTAPIIADKVKSKFKKTVSPRTIKLTYDRVAARKE